MFYNKSHRKKRFIVLVFFLLFGSFFIYSLVSEKGLFAFQIGLLFILCLVPIGLGRFCFGLFSPLPFTLLFLLVSFSIEPLLLLFQNSGTHELLSPYLVEEAVVKTMGYVLLFTLFIILGYQFHFGAFISKRLPTLPSKWSPKLIKFTVPLLIILGLTLYFILINIIGMSIYEICTQAFIFRYKILKMAGGLYHLRNFAYWCLWSAFWMPLVYFLLKPERLTFVKKLYLLVLFFLLTILNTGFGQRFLLIVPIISFFAALHLTGKKVSPLWLIATAVFLPILSFIYLSYRNMSFTGVDIGLLINQLRDTSLIDIFSKGMLLSVSRFAPLSLLIHSFPTPEVDFLYGKSFLNLFTIPLPMSLFPGRPIYTDTFLTRLLLPPTGEFSYGVAFSGIGEFYINFHIVGVVCGGLLFGIFLKMMEGYLVLNRGNPSVILWYVNGSVNGLFFPVVWLINSLYSGGTTEFLVATVLNVILCLFISGGKK
jgi:hypothetical protein